jgi:hypothetical protein
MISLVLQIFSGKELLVKKLADLRPRQGNLLRRNHFSGVYKPLLISFEVDATRPRPRANKISKKYNYKLKALEFTSGQDKKSFTVSPVA